MICNGFDPGMLAFLAGEDRYVGMQGEAPPLSPREYGVLVFVAVSVFLAGAILLGGFAA